jgi:outer membrane lipoprotein-sorting protein
MPNRSRAVCFLALSLGLSPLALAAGTIAPAYAASETSASAQAIIAKAQHYLNSIKTLKAHFVQVAPNGAITQGTAWLDRPGRMRFQYAPPTPLLLVAGHGFVLFRDTQLGQTSTIPIGETPLGILLSDHINLTGDGVTVTGVRQLPNEVQITLVRSKNSTEGSLTLTFSTDPWTLRQWTVVDAQGQPTTVTLTDVQTGLHIDQSLFEPVAPMTTSPGGGGGGG